MKKWLIGIVIFIGVIMGLIYFLIPNIISFRSTISFKANSQGVFRFLLDDNSWANWLQEKSGTTGEKDTSSDYYYNGYNYAIGAKKTSSIFINVRNAEAEAITILNLLPLSTDSTGLSWDGVMNTSYNPIKRIQVYFRSQKLKKDINSLMEKMNSFLSKPENVYGFKIQEELVTDTTLVSTYAPSENYPSTDFIYGLIDQLKNYIVSQSAKETGAPMLNITITDSVKYLTRVAIPVDKILKTSGSIAYRWMLGGGNIFVCEVKGGPYSIDKATRQVQYYMSDHQRATPAIPFQSLITDRRNETDTSKWVTKIYYPVI